MSRVFVATACGVEPSRHYQRTVVGGDALDGVAPYLEAHQLAEVQRIYGSRKIYAWGAVPGEKSGRHWTGLRVGDLLVFYETGLYVAYATIVATFPNEKLARFWWGEGKEGEVWSKIILLDWLKHISIPKQVFHHAIDWSMNGGPYGLMPIKEERVEDLEVRHGSFEAFLEANHNTGLSPVAHK